jgi:hypothetical protein
MAGALKNFMILLAFTSHLCTASFNLISAPVVPRMDEINALVEEMIKKNDPCLNSSRDFNQFFTNQGLDNYAARRALINRYIDLEKFPALNVKFYPNYLKGQPMLNDDLSYLILKSPRYCPVSDLLRVISSYHGLLYGILLRMFSTLNELTSFLRQRIIHVRYLELDNKQELPYYAKQEIIRLAESNDPILQQSQTLFSHLNHKFRRFTAPEFLIWEFAVLAQAKFLGNYFLPRNSVASYENPDRHAFIEDDLDVAIGFFITEHGFLVKDAESLAKHESLFKSNLKRFDMLRSILILRFESAELFNLILERFQREYPDYQKREIIKVEISKVRRLKRSGEEISVFQVYMRIAHLEEFLDLTIQEMSDLVLSCLS